VSTTTIWKGKGGTDLFVYCHIAASIIEQKVKETTDDSVAVELWGNGTSAYKPLLPHYGGTAGWLGYIARAAGRAGGPGEWFRNWCLTCWSAGGQVAKDVCVAGDDLPEAIVLLDAVYGSKPAGAKRGDGQVVWDASLQALGRYALAAARGERIMVLLHSRISTSYASSKECVEAIVRYVEAELGERLGPDPTASADVLDHHGFIEALAYGNLHVIEFAGMGADEHITEAHLYDEVWKRWIPWTKDTGAAPAPGSTPPPPSPPQSVLGLKRGDKGPLVTRWQLFLVGQDVPLKYGADGSFGPATEEATREFQLRHSLVQTGVVDAATRVVASALGLDGPSAEPPGSPADHAGPDWPPPPSFPPLVGTVERQRIFGPMTYVADPQPGNPEHIRVTNGWAAEHLVTVTVPELAGIQGAPSTGRIQLHRDIADQVLALFAAWKEAGLMPLVLSWAGSYAPRFIRGSTTSLSNHAFGTAFDINAPQNPLGARPALAGQKGSVRELVPLANAHGFYWGGHFKGRLDGMHFEAAVVGMTP